LVNSVSAVPFGRDPIDTFRSAKGSKGIRDMTKKIRQAFPLLFTLLLVACSAKQNGREELLLVLHTNDMHSWFAPRPGRLSNGDKVELGGAAVLGSMIDRFRADNPDRCLYLEAGDLLQGTPISSLTEGRGPVEVMNLLAPDAFELGNHEYDYGLDAQRQAFQGAKFPVLQGNVSWKNSQTPFFTDEIRFQRAGIEIAVLGLNSDELFELCDRSALGEIELGSSEARARDWLESCDADLKICLSHRGFLADSLLAVNVPGFDLIIGGHSHTTLEQPLKVGQSWISQAGDFGRYLGVDSLWVVPGKGLSRLSGGLLPVLNDAAPAREDISAVVARQEERVNLELAEKIAELSIPWPLDFHGESAIGNWLASALRIESSADVGLWNSGGIRKAMEAGDITLRDIWEIAPFGNEVLVAELRPAQLRFVFEDQLARDQLHMQFDGIRITAAADGGVGDILIEGEPIEGRDTISVVLGDYVWGQLLALEGFAGSPEQARHTGWIDRDVLIRRARAEKRVTMEKDGRWGLQGKAN
jgi:5'-nucleotidase/UDP-sugar diphosphatase